jgi:LysR family hydrogen peroxide-inducible transcriptional activator
MGFFMDDQQKFNFSLTQFEYALAIARYGHFARAAEACRVTQPTLSMQVQKLEEDLGVVLFDRSKKPVLLTDIGRKIIAQIQAVVFEARKIKTLIDEETKVGLRGSLRVAIIPTLAPYLIPKLLPVIEKAGPELNLVIQELQTSKIVESLSLDEIDVGLLATPLNSAQLFEAALFYEPFYLLCRKNDSFGDQKKVKYSQLSVEKMWLLEEGHCLRNQMMDICAIKKEKNFNRNYQFESGSLETLKNLVNSFGGYTLLPQLAIDDIGAHSKVIPFERPIPAREIGIVYRRAHYKAPLIEALGDLVLDCIPAEIKKIRPRDLRVVPIDEN